MTVQDSKASSSLHDEQSRADDRRVRIDRVGVKGLRHPVEVADRANQRQDTVAMIAMSVDLPEEFKGTHMSRFVEILNAHGNLIHVENIAEILEKMQERLHAKTAHLQMEFPYFMRKTAPATGAQGLVDYRAWFDAVRDGEVEQFRLGVDVPVTTLCPCSKAISARGAHNQRGYVKLEVEFSETVWIEELIELVEASASSEIFSLLKREDEKEVTERAYDNPVFVEDLVRNVALRVRDEKRITWYRIEAENVESIHNHSAYAMITSP